MDLVDEEHGPLPGEAAELLGFLDRLPQVRDAARHGRQVDEPRLRRLRCDGGERRLARPRWTPQDHGGQLAGVDRLPQDAALTDDVLLPDELGQVARAHPGSERASLRHAHHDTSIKGYMILGSHS